MKLGIRKTTAKSADAPADDEEALLHKTTPATRPAGAPSSGSGPGMDILQKVVEDSVSRVMSDEEDVHSGGAIGVIKDCFIGMVFGLVTISCLIFLDHHNVIHLESAHNFREAAFSSLNNPETITNLEESSGLKFVTSEQYNAWKQEVEDAKAKLEEANKKLEERTKEAEEKSKELAPLEEEYQKLVDNPVIGLDKYCGECAWQGRTNCDARKAYMMNTYNLGEVAAKLAAMNTPSCKKE